MLLSAYDAHGWSVQMPISRMFFDTYEIHLIVSSKNWAFGFAWGIGRQHAVRTAMASQNHLHPLCFTDSMLLSASNDSTI